MRLFIAAWPPPDVLDAIAALPRPAHDGIRWTTRDQWHITLRFLGEMGEMGELDEPPTIDLTPPTQTKPPAEAQTTTPAEAEATSKPPAEVELGPRSSVLGGAYLVLPARGLDALARAVTAATADLGQPPDRRPFRAHLTLARARARRLPKLDPVDLAARWTVDELAIVSSHLRPGGSRYETVGVVKLSAP